MASGMPPRVANRKPCAVLVNSPASHSPPNGIPIHKAALPSTTATASRPVTASARELRSSSSCASTAERTFLGADPADTRPGEAGGGAAGRNCLGRDRRLVLGAELVKPLENLGALHVELAEADDEAVAHGLEVLG